MKLGNVLKHWDVLIILLIGALLVGAAVWSLYTGTITYKFGRPQQSIPSTTIYRSSDPSGFYWGVGKLGVTGLAIMGLGLVLYRKNNK